VLARIATEHAITLVHVSSDYVFDGTKEGFYTEADPFAPLGVYGQTKAAADAIVATVPRHYVVRTSWVIGEGKNFVRTMAALAGRGIDPKVVDDQRGRLTFTPTIAAAIRHLVDTGASFGTYNVTNGGPTASWCEIAREVYRLSGHDPARVSPVSTSEYFAAATTPIAPRPANSALDLSGIEATGFVPQDWTADLVRYLSAQD
jgi:dTDP-4-dehydrorhamnose 3,5-epimerase/reductase